MLNKNDIGFTVIICKFEHRFAGLILETVTSDRLPEIMPNSMHDAVDVDSIVTVFCSLLSNSRGVSLPFCLARHCFHLLYTASFQIAKSM